MALQRRYPIGIQTFSEIIEGRYVYVDKTVDIYNLVTYGTKYTFLGRPRRFGKSLLVSTLQAYFEGRKELFEGLGISHLEKNWISYPVLHFSLAGVKGTEPEDLIAYLDLQLSQYEELYNTTAKSKNIGVRLSNIVLSAARSTGKKIVILIDEYDTPILNVVHDENKSKEIRQVLEILYGPLKDLDPYLRFVFITGITKFSQISIFSTLNNITNISMVPEYATICGVTLEELLSQLQPDILRLSNSLNLSSEDTIEKLKINYDGYAFTKNSPEIFNPFSLMSCFHHKEFDAYWFATGTPSYLVELLRKFHVVPSKIGGYEAVAADFDTPTENISSIVPLLYQSGYLTIKGYDPIGDIYFLDIPNQEVRTILKSILIS